MNDPISRIQSDLSLMRDAAGLGPSFDLQEARAIALGALLALPLALWGLFGSAESPYPELVIAATLAAIYVGSSLLSKRAHRQRIEEPFRWREHKISLLLVVLLSTAALSYLAVGLWNDISWNVVMATGIFFAGVSTLAVAVIDRKRFHLVGGALPTLVYGALFPLYDSRQLLFATAAWIAVSCLATSALMIRHLRDIEPNHEPD